MRPKTPSSNPIKNVTRSLAILLSLILLVAELSAQSGMRFVNYGAARGLSQNTVNVLLTDRDGFVWVGTQDGLNRFDGERFMVWPFVESAEALPDNFILSLAESPDGALYVGTRNGLYRINASRTIAAMIDLASVNRSAYHNTVDQLLTFGDAVYALCGGTLLRLLQGEHTVEQVADEHFLSMAASSGTLYLLRSDMAVIERTRDGSEREMIEIERVESKFLSVLDHDNLAIASEGTLRTYNYVRRLKTGEYQFKSPIVCTRWANDLLWVGTQGGLYCIENERALPVQPTLEGEGLEKDFIHCFETDNLGGFWVGSNRFGAFRHDLRSRYVLQVPGDLLADQVVWAALRHGRSLFIGSTEGLDWFDVATGWGEPSYRPEEFLVHRKRWSGFHVSSLHYDAGALWVATRKGQVKCLEQQGDDWVEQTHRDLNLEGSVYHLTRLRKGAMVVCGSAYSLVIQPDGTIDTLSLNRLSPEPISAYSHHIFATDDTLWFSTMSGLHRLTLNNRQLKLMGPQFDADRLSFPFISCSSRERGKRFLAGTLGDGFVELNAQGDSVVKYFSVLDGLDNGVVYGIVDSEYGVLASTNTGLSCATIDRIRNLRTSTGLPFSEHSQNAFGRMDNLPWFGGIDGLYLVHPDVFNVIDPHPRPVVSELLINYLPSEFHPAGQAANHALRLMPGDQVLTLGLALPGVYADRYELRYRMSGVSDAWAVLRNASDRITYTTLRGGDYLLDIQAVQAGGIEGETITVAVKVIPPYWETSWFLAAMVVVFSGLTYLLVRAAARRKLRVEVLKREASERVQLERERISMDLHDNIGSHITHVITSLDNLSFKIGRGKTANPSEAIDELSDFARGTMQQLRDTIWTLSQEEVVLSDFSRRISDHLGRVLGDLERPVFSIDMHTDADPVLAPQTAVQLFRVVQEALNNVLKHANAELITVHIKLDGPTLLLAMSDNGGGFIAGRDLSQSGHHGLRNMRHRVTTMGGTFNVVSAPGEGTRIEVKLNV